MEDKDQEGENNLPKFSLPFSTVVQKNLLYHASTIPTIPEEVQLDWGKEDENTSGDG